MKTAAGILAGGRARRFNGIAKGMLRDRHDETIARRLELAIRQSGLEDIVLLTNDRLSYESLGIPILPDLRPGFGPLAAIESGLEHFASSRGAMLFVACDLPNLTTCEIRLLLDAFFNGKSEAVVAQTAEDKMQSLCMVLSVALRKQVTQHLDAGRRSVMEFLLEQRAETVVFEDARPFYNINTPEDWRHWFADDAGY
jgi:molybdenum cofactor guanylyltransferase